MDILIISQENNILHICNKGYTVDYTFYNSKGHSIDGGILESEKDKFDTKLVLFDLVKDIKNTFSFSEPFMYLENERAEGLLELIEIEELKNTRTKVDDYLHSIKKDSFNEINLEKEI